MVATKMAGYLPYFIATRALPFPASFSLPIASTTRITAAVTPYSGRSFIGGQAVAALQGHAQQSSQLLQAISTVTSPSPGASLEAMAVVIGKTISGDTLSSQCQVYFPNMKSTINLGDGTSGNPSCGSLTTSRTAMSRLSLFVRVSWSAHANSSSVAYPALCEE